jgi:hypothetical protein
MTGAGVFTGAADLSELLLVVFLVWLELNCELVNLSTAGPHWGAGVSSMDLPPRKLAALAPQFSSTHAGHCAPAMEARHAMITVRDREAKMINGFVITHPQH